MIPSCRTRQPIRQIRVHGPEVVSEYRTAFARQSCAWPVPPGATIFRAGDSRGALTTTSARHVRLAPLCALTLLLTTYVGVRASSAEPQTATQTPVTAPTQTPAPAPTQTTDGSVAAPAQSGEEPTQTDSAHTSKGKDHKARTKTDGAEPSSGESVKAPKEKKDGANNNGDDSVRPPKHPSWKPVRGVRLDFKARIKSETR
ncbi:MAG: hypothetical protein DMF98_08265, partial [Acidobacteria bacterium]